MLIMTDSLTDETSTAIPRRKALSLVAMATLAGCGGGDGTDTPGTASQTPPTTAAPTGSPTQPGTDSPTAESPTDEQPTDEEPADESTPLPGDLSWDTASDWDRSPERQGIVHGSWTSAGGQALQLGYPMAASGLQAYYALNSPDMSGEPDITGNHPGSIQGTITTETGLHNSAAYRFTDGYVGINSPPVVDSSTSISVGFWLQTQADSRAGADDYMWHQQDGDTEFGVSIDSEGQLYVFTMQENTLGGSVPAVVNDGEWHHIVMTFDQERGRVRQYVDGALDVESNNYSETVAFSPGRAALGAAADGSKTLDGSIDDFRWYSRVLSEQEVARLHQNGTQGRLQTVEKSFEDSERPNLVGLDYDLNGGEIQVTVFGDRGGNTSEQHRVTLDGATNYEIPWQSLHRRFQFDLTFSTPSVNQTPVLRRLALG